MYTKHRPLPLFQGQIISEHASFCRELYVFFRRSLLIENIIKNINRVVICKFLVTKLLFTLSNNVYFSLFYRLFAVYKTCHFAKYL